MAKKNVNRADDMLESALDGHFGGRRNWHVIRGKTSHHQQSFHVLKGTLFVFHGSEISKRYCSTFTLVQYFDT